MAKVLIVDDEEISAMMLESEFVEHGHVVCTANDGKEALEIGRRFKPDILITDWRLDGETEAADVIEELKDHNQQLIIFICSGLPSEYIPLSADGGSNIFTKPVDPDKIVSLAHQKLNASR